MFWDITQRSPQRNHCSHLNLIPFRYNPVTALVPLSGTPPFQACPITDHFLTFHHGESHNGWFELAHFNSKLNAYQKLTAQKIVALKKDIFANLPTETMGIFHLEQILEKLLLGISVWEKRVPFVTSSIQGSPGRPGRLKDRVRYWTGDKDEKSVNGTQIPLGSFEENGTTFSEILFIPNNFQWNEPKSRVPFTSQTGFPVFFGKWKTLHETFNLPGVSLVPYSTVQESLHMYIHILHGNVCTIRDKKCKGFLLASHPFLHHTLGQQPYLPPHNNHLKNL